MPSSYRAYAVDSTDDGKRDIWGNWEDVIGSVANYFVRHRWRRNQEVVAQASLSDQWQGEVPKNSLKPSATISSLSRQGVMFSSSMPVDSKAQLLTMQDTNGSQYWIGFHNFFVITRYNRSVMYALAVHQLGQEIATNSPHAPTPYQLAASIPVQHPTAHEKVRHAPPLELLLTGPQCESPCRYGHALRIGHKPSRSVFESRSSIGHLPNSSYWSNSLW
jgi:hypothetical protein